MRCWVSGSPSRALLASPDWAAQDPACGAEKILSDMWQGMGLRVGRVGVLLAINHPAWGAEESCGSGSFQLAWQRLLFFEVSQF